MTSSQKGKPSTTISCSTPQASVCTPKPVSSAVGEDVLSRCKAAFDAVYNPGKTKFLTLAANCGLKTVGGMGMLVCQAVAAHELWYGASFKDSDIEQLICDAEAETARLFRA